MSLEQQPQFRGRAGNFTDRAQQKVCGFLDAIAAGECLGEIALVPRRPALAGVAFVR